MKKNIVKIEHTESIKEKNIQGFSIEQKEGKKFLCITLKAGKKIEIEISLYIRELYDILSIPDYLENKNTIEQIVAWATHEKNKWEKKYKECKKALKERLELPENKDKKDLFNILYVTSEQLTERMTIRSQFYETYMGQKSYSDEDITTLFQLDKLLKIINADKEGVFLPETKNRRLLDKKETYGHNDIISKKRIEEHLETIDKLFQSFEYSRFFGDDPRPFPQWSTDEKAIFYRKFKHPIKDTDSTTQAATHNNEIIIYNNALIQLGLKDELEKLFGRKEVGNRGYDKYLFEKEMDDAITFNHDTGKIEINNKKISPLSSKETPLSVAISDVYKKLQLLGLYYRDELYIKTKEGNIPFTGGEIAEKSIDGALYYKNHQEKYTEGIPKSFITDHDCGEENTVHKPLINLKIDDLSYGALEDVFALLGESNVAPVFSLMITNGLLTGLQRNKGENNENLSQGDNIS